MTDIDTIVTDRIKRYKCVELVDVPLLSWTKIDLWEELKNPEGHIQLIFQESPNKLFITGDFGSFIFGKDIVHIDTFFKGDTPNLGYWEGKCEASPKPLLCEEVDLEKVRKLIEEYSVDKISEEERETFTEELESLTEGLFSMDTNMYRAYDRLYEFFENYNWDTYDVSGIIDKSRDWLGNYVFICHVIQWVSNNLLDWKKETSPMKCNVFKNSVML